MKICLVSSSGGHLEELYCLKALGDKYDSFLITEDSVFKELVMGKRQYYLTQINRREKNFIFSFVKLFGNAVKILRVERPDVVISTGALVSFPFCLIGKLMRAKIIYIESFARTSSRSLTGRMVYHFSDLFIVQWKELLKCYPRAKYTGGIF